MIEQLILPLALLPQRESDLSDILKIVILLLLPVLLGLGKAIMDKVKGTAESTRRARRHPPGAMPPGLEERPVSSARLVEGAEEPVDPEEFWDDLVAQATGEPSPGGETIVPLPPTAVAVTTTATDDTPLGVDLDRLDESLPSHHEEYFESHPHADLAPRREVGRPIHRAPMGRGRTAQRTRGGVLSGSTAGRDTWKRAIVLAEVLGSPLALRSREGQPGMR